ncbi:MAG: methylated-DNA--[protein]-cysteine S-methyltransferase [Geothrix sp.]|uniref:methylated-DNA--[protein]-cysteine S-methyltransferase n=1 Tax=Geothrix sp. TaxID=1962974 RepID=UPI0017DED905|nr:methylated-DNA--[protein]-cysteine S-methyltransferase [Geothrix sp.]NWJ39907.1 methylated-DNA--[protein]-cysteine S-methyltransferase [Geothrix sp.]WIL22081.1 MAG: methylated-DNA--[protein]-cysteine S-methyltransferase [Geothrix sp.]
MNGIRLIDTSLGPVQAAFDAEGAVIYLGFADHEFREALLAKVARLGPASRLDAAVVDRLHEQLEAYVSGGRKAFDILFRLHGSPFEQRVWAGLQRIPFGETRSYGQLAAELGDPNLSRAVGRANGANPVSILVPCHRVIGANGTLTGYAGGLAMKERLLRLEGALRPGLFPGDRAPVRAGSLR